MKNEILSPQQGLILRLAVGLVFGLALGALYDQLDPVKNPPVLWMQIVVPVLTLGAFIIWASAAAMRRISLGVWSAIALGLIALIAWNSLAHGDTDQYNPFFLNLAFLIYPFLFIANELVSSGDQAGKPIAPYALYFDEAWKRGVQLALAGLFTIMFWGILWLGATLLGFIGFDWFKTMIQNEYFAWPASGLAIAAAVHLGDVQTKLMHAFRSLVLGVLSWLLPVITLIGVIFAVSLCFSGLEPLWRTKAATASLLAACIALVLLINAAYQQGDEERPVHVVLKWSARLACGLLLVFSVLAAYSLYLRIHQYGLTPERFLAGVGVFIAVLFGLGYAYAAVLPRGRWLATIETINISLAFVKVAVFLAVLTPLADPLRLSADSQASRLESGAVALDKFDWRVLRYETGTYGREALARLAKSGKTDAIRAKAKEALAWKDEDRWDHAVAEPVIMVKPEIQRLHIVSPGTALPTSFLEQAFTSDDWESICFKESKACDVLLLDMNDDGNAELLVLDNRRLRTIYEDAGRWKIAPIFFIVDSDDVTAFKAGKVKPSKPQWNDLDINGEVQTASR
ncbi:hypothetical protein ABI_41970 [Asticcacaulis biprosthecium C19]|uniref:DUF4153 domain-containing protein n=1 Tax=Asticcacaulis biprosthecium C19 TaxID=715226 RepID=F4QSQ4_9CAUL|nr:DUF4153 domain-containing protein [Asticcacaulis biprosthecium]EGF89774.1 hypothetical protein ABI_41970 [Asticcacaulis biprosthecium C19]